MYKNTKKINKKTNIIIILLIIIILGIIGGIVYEKHKVYNTSFMGIEFKGEKKSKIDKSIKDMNTYQDIYSGIITKNNINDGYIEYNSKINYINLINTNNSTIIRMFEDKNKDIKNIAFTLNKDINNIVLLNSDELCKFLDYKDSSILNNSYEDLMNKYKENPNSSNLINNSIFVFSETNKDYPTHRILICISNVSDKQYKVEIIKEPLKYNIDINK